MLVVAQSEFLFMKWSVIAGNGFSSTPDLNSWNKWGKNKKVQVGHKFNRQKQPDERYVVRLCTFHDLL